MWGLTIAGGIGNPSGCAMNSADDELAVLVAVASDVEAAPIVSTLEAHGILATATGGFTSDFKAEAPGNVQVVVRRADLEQAIQVLNVVLLASPALLMLYFFR
jgi:hypothetical protein